MIRDMISSSVPFPSLSTNLAGLDLASPLILAAGTAGYVDELDGVTDLSTSGGVGAVVTKSITRDSREGNATWRIVEHKAGMLNAIGLANVGLDVFVRDVVPQIERFVGGRGVKANPPPAPSLGEGESDGVNQCRH